MNRKAVFGLGALWIMLWISHALDRREAIARGLPTLVLSVSERAVIETGDPELHRGIRSGVPPRPEASEFERFRTAFERFPSASPEGWIANWLTSLSLLKFVILVQVYYFFLMRPRWSASGIDDRVGMVLLPLAAAVAYLEAAMPRSAWSNWDAWAVWDFKTKAVLHEGWLPNAFLTNPEYGFTHPEYPLLWPWLQAGMALLAGGFDTQVLRMLPFLCAAALPFLTATLLAEVGIRHGRWLVAGAIATLPIVLHHSSNGYVDWPLATVEAAALLLVLRCARGAAPGWAVGLAAGLAANLKMEGLIFGVGVLAGLALSRGKRSSLLQAAGVFLLLALPWQLYRSSLGITPADFGLPVAQAVAEFPRRMFLFIRAFLLEAFGAGPNGRTLADWWIHLSSSWLVFWFVAGYALFTGWRRLGDPALRIPVVVVGIQVLGALGAYVFTIRDVQWLLSASLDRLMLQWVPAVTVLAAVLLARKS